MRTVVCLVVLALAVVSAEEKSLVGPDVELLSKCTDSLTTLMTSKAKAITGLNGIAAHLKDDKPPAKTGDSAKPAVKPDAPVAAKNGPQDGADKQKVVPKAAATKEEELGEWREPVESAHWAGLKSLSHKDINMFLSDVERLAADSTKVLKKVEKKESVLDAAPLSTPKESEVMMLGEDDEAPSSPQDKAGEKVDGNAPKPAMPKAQAPPSGINHMKHLLDICVSNVVKVSTALTSLNSYAKCLKTSKPTAASMWPNVKACVAKKPTTIKEPKPEKANQKAKASAEEAQAKTEKDAQPKEKAPKPIPAKKPEAAAPK